MNRTYVTIGLLLVAAVVPGAGTATAATGAQSQTSAYAGTHVSFDATGSAVSNYSVDGAQVFESAAVQSQATAESQGTISLGGSLSALTSLSGTALTLESRTETRASVTAESGARLTAHDNHHGILVVESGGESQYVQVNLSGSTEASAESEGRVHVETDDGASGTFLVVGDGSVTVNEEGNVSAAVEGDGKLVFRAYAEGRTEADETEERMIANGTAGSEAYVTAEGESTVVDTVNYTRDMSVEVTQRSEGTVEMTATRAESEGRVVITSVAESAVDARGGLDVTVDGEAAAQASSYSALEAAAEGETASRYMVRQASSASASAEASATVYVALDHFSSRDVVMSEDGSGDSQTTTDGSQTTDDGTGDATENADGDTTRSDGDAGTTADDGSTGTTVDDGDAGTTAQDASGTETTDGGGLPGFGAGVAALAVVAGTVLALRRRG